MVELKRAVRQAAGGDEQAAGLLFDTYYPRVVRYAMAKLGRTADAEDVAAETFAKVLRDLGRFSWRGAGFEAWLFRIAANLVVDQVRRSGREHLSDNVLDSEAAQELSPEDFVVAGEVRDELREALAQLPTEQREVLILRFAAGLDTGEAAATMGKKANAIRQLQFRALKNLRELMPEGAGLV